MPLYPGAKVLIRKNLEAIPAGQKVGNIVIGALTDKQLEAINAQRTEDELPKFSSLVAMSTKVEFSKTTMTSKTSLKRLKVRYRSKPKSSSPGT